MPFSGGCPGPLLTKISVPTLVAPGRPWGSIGPPLGAVGDHSLQKLVCPLWCPPRGFMGPYRGSFGRRWRKEKPHGAHWGLMGLLRQAHWPASSASPTTWPSQPLVWAGALTSETRQQEWSGKLVDSARLSATRHCLVGLADQNGEVRYSSRLRRPRST